MMSLSASWDDIATSRQVFEGMKKMRPVVGFGDAGTNTHHVAGSPSMPLALVNPSTRPPPLGMSTTWAKMPSCTSVVSATCFHER